MTMVPHDVQKANVDACRLNAWTRRTLRSWPIRFMKVRGNMWKFPLTYYASWNPKLRPTLHFYERYKIACVVWKRPPTRIANAAATPICKSPWIAIGWNGRLTKTEMGISPCSIIACESRDRNCVSSPELPSIPEQIWTTKIKASNCLFSTHWIFFVFSLSNNWT